MKNSHPLDELDHGILRQLREDPQRSCKSIAESLVVTESTVASRIREMENDGVMKVMAQRSFRAAGFDVLANIDLTVSGRAVDAVAEELAAMDGVAVVTINIGDPSLSLLVMASSLGSLQTSVIEGIAKVEGVRSTETMIYADIIKYRSDFAIL
jgi:Lrp/AsnC family leucine-responsive transcriptional regulator